MTPPLNEEARILGNSEELKASSARQSLDGNAEGPSTLRDLGKASLLADCYSKSSPIWIRVANA